MRGAPRGSVPCITKGKQNAGDSSSIITFTLGDYHDKFMSNDVSFNSCAGLRTFANLSWTDELAACEEARAHTLRLCYNASLY